MGARPQKAWNPTLAEITIHGGQARSKKSDMLKKYAALFVLFRSVVDIVMIGMVWIGAYYLRFYSSHGYSFRMTDVSVISRGVFFG